MTYIAEIEHLLESSGCSNDFYDTHQSVRSKGCVKPLTDDERLEVDMNSGPHREEWRPLRADRMGAI